MESAHTPLWGQLANRWFRESIATDSLRVLLRDPDLRTSFLGMVEERTGVRLAGISGFHREISTKGGRIDFLGVDHQERPLLVVESKLGHWMSTRQMANYLAHQRDGLSQSTSQLSGVLMLLVPSGRLAEALGVMQAVAMGEGDLSGTGPRIEFTAMAWEEVLDRLASVPQDDCAVSLAADVAQLRAAFEAFTEWTKPVETIEPDERSAYLKTVLQNAKAEFPSSVRPIRHKDKDFAEFRYFRIPGSATWYAVGVARPVENLADHEVWLRFHKVTGEFERVREVLLSSSLASKVRIHRKHVWLPLKVEAGLSSIALGESLVAQTREILDVIRVGGPQDDLLGRESTDGGPSE